MSVLDRGPRGNIVSATQVDVSLGTLIYSNPRLPEAFNGNAENALNYLVAHAFPNYKSTVANPAALPVSGSPNDYVIVSDDGDGKSAGYVWIVKDNAGAWEKRYDVDWSFEGIYSETLNRTQYMYVHKYGMTDKDALGAAITGLYAGQIIYGGDDANQNLTLNANSEDGTGFVQTDNTFRPTSDNALDLGTSALKFRSAYLGTSLVVGTLTVGPASITDSSGAIVFGDENLSTSGDFEADVITALTSVEVGTLSIQTGSITDSSGTIDFDNEDLTTTGTITAGASTLGDITLGIGSITSASPAISFGSNNLSTTGTLGAGNAQFTRVDSDNLRLDGNTLSALNVNGSVLVVANGTGIIDLQSPATTLGITATGTVGITGQLNADNLRLDGNTLSSTNTDGDINLSPNGVGEVVISSHVMPSTDNARDLGAIGLRFKDLFLSSEISDGTDAITMATLLSFRDANTGVNTGDALFWDGTKWAPSAPDTEITHGDLAGLTTGDAGHTQFVMLAGRSGGQTVQGGTGAGEHLVLESTANASKGLVLTRDVLAPFTTASYSGGWLGTDLGGTANIFRDVYTKGEFLGLRFQNVSSNPSNSAQNVGRAVYNTTEEKLYIDTGTMWISAGGSGEKFISDTVWNGSDTTKDIDVSSTITDARTALWQLCENSNDFERIFTSIKAISATTVRITVAPALPAGSYRLIGLN